MGTTTIVRPNLILFDWFGTVSEPLGLNYMPQVMFAWKPVQLFLTACRARTVFFVCLKTIEVPARRKVTFPMGSYGAKTLKFTTRLCLIQPHDIQ